MKKLMFIIALLLILNTRGVKAFSPILYSGIEVYIQDSCNGENYDSWKIDILVNKTELSNIQIQDSVNSSYQEKFLDYESYEYLNDSSTNWVSYSAFYIGADINYDEYNCVTEFAYNHIDEINNFIFIAFDEDGVIVFESEEISAKALDFNYEPEQGYINFDYSDLEFELVMTRIAINPAEILFKEILFFMVVPMIIFMILAEVFKIAKKEVIVVSILTRIETYFMYIFITVFTFHNLDSWIFLPIYILVSISEISLFNVFYPNLSMKNIYKLVSVTYVLIIVLYFIVFVLFYDYIYY